MANAKPRASSADADAIAKSTKTDAPLDAAPTTEPVGRFGQDVTFTLPNPKLRLLGLGLFLVALGVAVFLVPDKGDGRAGLMKIIAVLIIGLGGWMLSMAVRLFGVKEGNAVVTTRELHVTRPGNATQTVALEAITRVLHATNRGQRQHMLFETDNGTNLVLPAGNITAEDEPVIAALVLRRAELRRAGVKTRAELAAAEAFLSTVASGIQPFAVQVVTKGKVIVDVAIALNREHLRTAEGGAPISDAVAEDGTKRQVYVPEAVLAVLKNEDTALTNAKPLRGVS